MPLFSGGLCRFLIPGLLLWFPARAAGASAQLGKSGGSVERVLPPGQTHTYEIAVRSGDFVHLDVEQNHLDAVVRILSSEGAVLAEVNNAADRPEALSLSAVTPGDGDARIEIRLRGPRSASGLYTLVVAPPHAATSDDRKRLEAERLRAGADQLLARSSADSSRKALEQYERTLATWREIGAHREEAATLAKMSDALADMGDLRQSLGRAEEALALWRSEGDRRGEAAALDQIGLNRSALGEQRAALEILEQALALRRAAADLRGQTETLNNIAVTLGDYGRIPEAIARFTEALDLARSTGDRLNEAIALKNRASNYVGLGETDRALADFRDALIRFRSMGNRREEGVTRYEIGNARLRSGEASAALRDYGLALTILREVGDRVFEALTLNQMGNARLATRKPRNALSDFQLALELMRASGSRNLETMILFNIARARLDMGDTAEARDRLRQVLPLLQAMDDRWNEAMALSDLARAEQALGDLEAARSRVEEALRLTESLRGSIPDVGQRASYMAKTRDRYDLLIDVLMGLHAKQPERGWDAEALHVSERAKARSLVDLLAEARIDLREGVDATLLEKERALETQIEGRRREEQQRLAGTGPEHPASDGRALDALLAEYEDVQGRLRAASPRYAALARPQPLTLQEIREQVVDHDTVLLEYALGEKRSFVWAVTADTLTSHELPSLKVVDAAAHRLYEAWSTGSGVDAAEGRRRALALSRMLLGPVARELADKKRLAIVAEGALLYLPFAALPSPGSGREATPLVEEHEVVSLPSATTLAVLRREASGRRAPERWVAVLADPVFDRSDPRVSGAARSGAAPRSPAAVNDDLTRSMQESGLRRLERLEGSRQEARSIAAVAGPGEAFSALDF